MKKNEAFKYACLFYVWTAQMLVIKMQQKKAKSNFYMFIVKILDLSNFNYKLFSWITVSGRTLLQSLK